MSGEALPGDVEWTAFVLGEALQPVNQKQIRVISRPLVSTEVVVGGCVGVGESNTRRRFQEDDISHYIYTVFIPSEFHIYQIVIN